MQPIRWPLEQRVRRAGAGDVLTIGDRIHRTSALRSTDPADRGLHHGPAPTIMIVDIRTETIIDRPVDTVARYASDPTNAPHWYVNIDSVEWETPPPVALGSRVAFVARFLGRRLAYTYEITELIPGQRLVMRTAQGPFPMETTYTWAATDGDATRMSLRNQGEPTGFAAVTAPVMTRAMSRANRKDLARLKAILERT